MKTSQIRRLCNYPKHKIGLPKALWISTTPEVYNNTLKWPDYLNLGSKNQPRNICDDRTPKLHRLVYRARSFPVAKLCVPLFNRNSPNVNPLVKMRCHEHI
ncbi:hypothetical protein QQG55_25185 [Brugia pahangi]